MPNIKVIATLSLMALAACQPRSLPPVAPGGGAMPAGNQIGAAEEQQIPIRVLRQINTLRANIAVPPLVLNPQLSAAALAHSRDMSAQNRAWHWGSDGSSPLDRARRAGYFGTIIGENISESYENDIQTLTAWMGTRDTRDVIMDPAATNLGFAFYQEPSGKLWWTLLTGS